MKLYKISQDVNEDYDTYSDAVVCAESEKEAQKMHPRDGEKFIKDTSQCGTWAKSFKEVKVEYLGEAKEGMEKGVICHSFHAG